LSKSTTSRTSKQNKVLTIPERAALLARQTRNTKSLICDFPWKVGEIILENENFSKIARCAFGAPKAQSASYEWSAPRKLYRVLRKI
jgi:hypothetical protein